MTLDWWSSISAGITLDQMIVLPPGVRTRNNDYVAKGLRLDPDHIVQVQRAWERFRTHAGAPPPDAFEGRGIVFLGGKLNYLVPALVALKALRRTGCTLPVEMWFPDNEAPSTELVPLIERMGVHVRIFPLPSTLGQGSYFMKAIVVMLSSFKELLFLDADNAAVTDPTKLFDHPLYTSTGALFWCDFWDASWAPDAPAVLSVPPERFPSYTLESGQMLLDKSRHWPALISALYFNLNYQLFAPLFTNYMGLGDKETFGMALLAHGHNYSVIPHSVTSLGRLQRRCHWSIYCYDTLQTNTMAQLDPDGDLIFLHTNMPPKWYLAVEADRRNAIPRWQVMSPGPHQPIEAFPPLSLEWFGEDIEAALHNAVLSLRCDETVAAEAADYERDLPPYARALPLMSNARLPFRSGSTELLQAFSDPGLTGDFLKVTPPSLLQRIECLWNRKSFGKKNYWRDVWLKPRTSRLISRADFLSLGAG